MAVRLFTTIQMAEEQRIKDAGYAWDNSDRASEVNSLVVQRTVEGAAYFEDASGRRLVPAEFAMLFTHREPTRYGYPGDATTAYRHQYIAVAPAAGVNELFEGLRREFGPVIRCPHNSEASHLFSEIVDRVRRRAGDDRYTETELVLRLLIALYREQVRQTMRRDPIEYGHYYLCDRFRTPIDLKGLAEKCGVSREHLSREYTLRFGEPPGQVLRRLRLEHARTLLSTGLVIEDVAIASGFASADTFYRAYRRAYGVSPGSLRQTTESQAAARANGSGRGRTLPAGKAKRGRGKSASAA